MELFELGFWLKNVEMPEVFRSLAFWLLKVDVLFLLWALSKKKLTSPMDIKTHHVAASAENPQLLVQSDSTGKVAAHKPAALKRVKLTLGWFTFLRVCTRSQKSGPI